MTCEQRASQIAELEAANARLMERVALFADELSSVGDGKNAAVAAAETRYWLAQRDFERDMNALEAKLEEFVAQAEDGKRPWWEHGPTVADLLDWMGENESNYVGPDGRLVTASEFIQGRYQGDAAELKPVSVPDARDLLREPWKWDAEYRAMKEQTRV